MITTFLRYYLKYLPDKLITTFKFKTFIACTRDQLDHVMKGSVVTLFISKSGAPAATHSPRLCYDTLWEPTYPHLESHFPILSARTHRHIDSDPDATPWLDASKVQVSSESGRGSRIGVDNGEDGGIYGTATVGTP